MPPFVPQHQPGGGPNGGMPAGMAGMNMGMNMQSMGGAPMGGAINVPGGMNPGMNVNGPNMGGMAGPPNNMTMGVNGPGVGIGPNGQRQGMQRKMAVGQMPMGGVRHGMPQRINPAMQNGMGAAIPGQGSMGPMPTLMSGAPNLAGAQGGIGNMGGPGTGGPNGPGGVGGMARMIPPMGGAHGGMSLGQPGSMGGHNMAPGSGPGMGGSGAMSTMGGMAGLNGMAGPGAPGMASNPMGANNMSNGPWSDRQYPDNIVKRNNAGQLEDFNPIPTPQHPSGHPLGPQSQHLHGVGGSQIGGPGQHGVGGPGHHPQMGQQAPPPSQPSAGSPVANLPAHHQSQLPGQMGGSTPGPGGPMSGAHMGQPGVIPRMATPVHPGGPGGPLLPNPPAPSPHRMSGSPALHQGHPHQQHIAGSPGHPNQMSSPRHMTSSSPAPGQGPHPSRSNAPTPVPPRGASVDPMGGMRPDGMQHNEMRLPSDPPAMIRVDGGGVMGGVVRGPDGSLRPANDMMVFRDGRLLRDMQQPAEGINRAPSADGMVRQGNVGLPPNGMRAGEIGRLGSDGLVRAGAPYPQPPYGVQAGSFPPYGGIHPTPAQQHQNMQTQRGAGGAVGPGPGPGGPPRAGSVDDLALSSQMDLQGDLDIVGMHGPGRPTLARGSLPPQMQMMNGVGGPRTGPGGPMMMARRPTLMQSRPFPIGMGVIRILELSKELSSMKDKMLADWLRFREEFFTQSGSITMTIFYNVEGRKYMVAPELLPRYFLAFFESGVNKMSLGLNGATETTEGCQNEQLESYVSTTHAVWRYELDNGWIVEYNGPLKVHLVAEQVPGDPQSFRLKINDMTYTAPTTSYFFRPERIEGNLLASGHEVGPMTPRISPGLAARQTGEPMGGPGVGLGDDHSTFIEHEERIVYEKASLPPKPFQAYGLPANVWRLLTLSACVHELVPIMELENTFQSGPLSALDQYADMDQTARHDVGLDHMGDGMGGHPFPHFNHGFNPSHMPDHSPALTHSQVGMHHGPPQGAIPTTGRPTPTPPPIRQGGRGGVPLAGSGDLPPVPGLGVAIPPGIPQGMIMSQSPLLNHSGPPGQQSNTQLNLKRKQQAEQGPESMGGPSNSQPPRGMPNSNNQNRFSKSSPVGTRKKAKTNPSALS
ncbi:hypothetical protein BN14_00574 [Rhizoctonia solani AG-1 IB]|uniref:Uncharacterized protein n=1 Tax=Thanatephorus cucumeris (strain AG1-IB / isolate 7/3/14) TaxID=1108050 RepID=M5BS51_THACB|nr:hypothetical protein BN14_00574 [Rhizoctonia solani AG-1 IB]